jgi:hypothetical protein
MRGTWETTGGGGTSTAMGIAVLVISAAIAAALYRAIPSLLPWLAGAVIACAAAVVAIGVLALRIRRADAEAAEQNRQQALAREQQAAFQRRQAEELRHRRDLEIAAASAPRVEVRNVIDPAGLIGAALNAQYSYAAQAQPARPARVTIRGELER